MDEEFVTQRRNKTASIIESPNTSFLSTSSTHSLPDLSTEQCDINVLKEEIECLRNQLETANSKIKNLILENNRLKAKSSPKAITKTNSPSVCKPISLDGATTKNSNKLLSKSFSPIVNNQIANTYQNMQDDNINKICKDIPKESILQPIDETQKCIQDVPKNDPEILIIGGQQFIGLAPILIRSRRNTKYQKYKIHSFTKPYAPAADILSCSNMLRDYDDNYLIISIGENDSNPFQLMASLTKTLGSFKNANIIVINL
ncbi:unnamed protein product [Colias eurytheme]|nr:unnamed protein product [Colias eurytheme]